MTHHCLETNTNTAVFLALSSHLSYHKIAHYGQCSCIQSHFLSHSDEFENKYVSQGYEKDRSIEETLDVGWELLRTMPRSELKRVKKEYLDEFYDKK